MQDSKHAAAWLEGTALAVFQQIRDSDPLLVDGASDIAATSILDALETARAITRNSSGMVRLHSGGVVPSWLPRTPVLSKLARAMRDGLERADNGAIAVPASGELPTKRTNRA
jgi:hypothetical protein